MNYFIAPLSVFQTLNIKYLTMYKVHMQGGAIRTLLYGCAYVWGVIHSLIYTHRPYINLHLNQKCCSSNIYLLNPNSHSQNIIMKYYNHRQTHCTMSKYSNPIKCKHKEASNKHSIDPSLSRPYMIAQKTVSHDEAMRL